MSDEASDSADIAGVPLDDAVETVVARDDTPGPEWVRRALERISEGGVVCADGINSAVADASMALSNAEGRAELASVTLAEVRETAADVPTLDTVDAQLDGFESGVADLEQSISESNDLLQRVLDYDDPDDYWAVAADIQQLVDSANEAHGTAAELNTELESFERWLTDPTYRDGELERDVDVLEQSFDALAESLDEIEAALAGEQTAVGDETAAVTDDDIAAAWLNATVDLRVKTLGIEDARAELSDLRTWASEAGIGEAERQDDIEDRLDSLADRQTALRDRLDDLTRSDWEDRFASELDAIETALDTFEPPVDFGAVQQVLDEHRLD